MKLWPFQETIPDRDGAPYLTRYTILWAYYFRIYVHKLHQADEDRHLHNHPWAFTSIILSGGYWEELPRGLEPDELCIPGHMPTALKIRKPFDVIRHRASQLHRIFKLLTSRPTWTLILAGRKYGGWGFYVDGMFIPHERYLGNRRKY